MTARELNKIRTKVKRCLKLWVNILGLEKWDLKFKYPHKLPEELQQEEAGWDYFADCDPSWEYSTAGITFYLSTLAKLTDDKIEEIVVHELLHCLVNEMREKDRKHEERVVSALTSSLLKARKQ